MYHENQKAHYAISLRLAQNAYMLVLHQTRLFFLSSLIADLSPLALGRTDCSVGLSRHTD
jgi:hypothetical protein